MKSPLNRAYRWLRGDRIIATLVLLPDQEIVDVRTNVAAHYCERQGDVVMVYSRGPTSLVAQTCFVLGPR